MRVLLALLFAASSAQAVTYTFTGPDASLTDPNNSANTLDVPVGFTLTQDRAVDTVSFADVPDPQSVGTMALLFPALDPGGSDSVLVSAAGTTLADAFFAAGAFVADGVNLFEDATGDNYTLTVSGIVGASDVAEPAGLAVLGAGLLAMAALHRLQARRRYSVVARSVRSSSSRLVGTTTLANGSMPSRGR